MGRRVEIVRFAKFLGPVLAGFFISLPVWANSTPKGLTDFLYRVAREHRQAGNIDDAIHELHKVLMLDPAHAPAKRELSELESLQDERWQAIDQAISRIIEGQAAGTSKVTQQRAQPSDHMLTRLRRAANRLFTSSESRQAAGPSTRTIPVVPSPTRMVGRGSTPRLRESGARVRAPDPELNRVKWFYVFGRQGKVDYGALTDPQDVVIALPRTHEGTVGIRVIDADIRGRYDEQDGDWNTSTEFRLFGGSTLLESRVVGPSSPDGTTLQFTPVTMGQGERQGEQVFFRVEAAGLDGDDNNLFAVEVDSPDAHLLSFNPAIRLARQAGERMRFFPEVPQGASRLVEENYDLDRDGGLARLIPSTRGATRRKGIPLTPSGSGAWATTDVAVPPLTDGTRWIYQMTKGAQRNGNMSFRMKDQSGRPLPVYFTPDGGPSAVSAHAEVAGAPHACKTFEFDAAGSSDPEHGILSYHWDFGDGTTADGIRAQHTYAAAGEYRAVLTVKDPSGTACCEESDEQLLRVHLPPRAVLEVPASACAGSPVQLSAKGSTDSAGDRLAYRWEFGDGTTGSGMETTHAYTRGGTYQVKLVVDDQQGSSCSTDAATAIVRVNSAPIAHANDPIAACASRPTDPLEAVFSAAGSSDPDGGHLSYHWDFGDGMTADGARASHRYARGGRYGAILTVDDGLGTACSIARQTVPVQVNHAPVAAVDSRVAGCPGQDMLFDAGRSADPDGDVLTYQWEFGDGQAGTGQTVRHRYAAPGGFPVKITVDDGSGMACGASTARSRADINAPPVAKIRVQARQ